MRVFLNQEEMEYIREAFVRAKYGEEYTTSRIAKRIIEKLDKGKEAAP